MIFRGREFILIFFIDSIECRNFAPKKILSIFPRWGTTIKNRKVAWSSATLIGQIWRAGYLNPSSSLSPFSHQFLQFHKILRGQCVKVFGSEQLVYEKKPYFIPTLCILCRFLKRRVLNNTELALSLTVL